MIMNQVEDIWKYLEEIADPEIPVLNVIEMGIVRGVEEKMKNGEQHFDIIITPTYNGCPAMDIISTQIRMTLMSYEVKNFSIVEKLSPAWTTDWMSDEAKAKMEKFGIAPPRIKMNERGERIEEIFCPKCHSQNVMKISEFGSTSCKAMYKCEACFEPFEHFKCH